MGEAVKSGIGASGTWTPAGQRGKGSSFQLCGIDVNTIESKDGIKRTRDRTLHCIVMVSMFSPRWKCDVQGSDPNTKHVSIGFMIMVDARVDTILHGYDDGPGGTGIDAM